MKKTKLISLLSGAAAVLTVAPLAVTACSKKQDQGTFDIDDSKVVKTINGELGNEYARYCDVDYTGFVLKNADVNDIEATITDISVTTITASDITVSANNDGTFGVHARFAADYFLYNRTIIFKMTIAQKSKPENKKTIEGFSLHFGVCEWAVEADSDFSRVQTLVTKQTKLSYIIDGTFSVVNGVDKVTDFTDFYVDVYSTTGSTATADIIQTEDTKFGIILNLESIASNGSMHFILCIKHKQYPNWYSPIDLVIYSTDDYSYGFEYSTVGTTNACITKCNIHDDNVVIPEKVTTTAGTQLTVTQLNSGIFKNKYNLKSVTIPKNVTAINKTSECGLFAGTVVEDVIVADGNTKYTSKDSSNKECHCLMSSDRKTIIAGTSKTTFASTVTTIGQTAFHSLQSLTSISIPKTVTTINKNAFKECKYLEKVVLPTSIKSLPYSCFHTCTSLKSINLENITVFNNSALFNCKSLPTLTISKNVTSLGEAEFNPFGGCSSLTKIVVEAGNNTYTSTDANGKECNCIMNKGRTQIYSACRNTKVLDTVTVLGTNAFAYQTELQSIDLPNITRIDKYCFAGCTNLSSITIPKVTDLGEGVFLNCSKLTGIVLNEGITAILARCFEGCSALKTITSTTSFTSIGNSAFLNCSSLVAEPKLATTAKLGTSAFENCSLITKADLSADTTITSIPSRCFKGCTSLTEVKLPTNCVEIASNAFAYCSNLPSIDLAKITKIGASAFEGCAKLTGITLNAALTTIPARTFYYCSALTSIAVPNKVTTINASAFEGCGSLATVNFTDTPTLTTIGENAFFKCSALTTIVIPASVKNINAYAFTESGLTSAKLDTDTSKKWRYALTEEEVTEDLTQTGVAAELLLTGVALTHTAA